MCFLEPKVTGRGPRPVEFPEEPTAANGQSSRGFTLLEPDRGQLDQFVRALFRYADPQGWVSLRTFTHVKGKPPYDIESIPLSATGGLDYVVRQRRSSTSKQTTRVITRATARSAAERALFDDVHFRSDGHIV
jgi:hypothetical protein